METVNSACSSNRDEQLEKSEEQMLQVIPNTISISSAASNLETASLKCCSLDHARSVSSSVDCVGSTFPINSKNISSRIGTSAFIRKDSSVSNNYYYNPQLPFGYVVSGKYVVVWAADRFEADDILQDSLDIII
jgi:hypothetical protein